MAAEQQKPQFKLPALPEPFLSLGGGVDVYTVEQLYLYAQAYADALIAAATGEPEWLAAAMQLADTYAVMMARARSELDHQGESDTAAVTAAREAIFAHLRTRPSPTVEPQE